MIYFYLLVVLVIFYLFTVFKRTKKYKYNQNEDYFYNLNIINTLNIKNNQIILDENFKSYDSLFLKVELNKNYLSYFFKPYIQIENTKHYFEYGAKGIRYLNISHIKNDTFALKFSNVKLKKTSIELIGYKNNITSSQKTLILAPHADDAEIAAFGFYKNAKDVTIVTTTIGEHGLCNYCDIYEKNRTKNSLQKAKLRTMDALSVGLLGDVDIKNNLTLGYFGGSLEWMYKNQNQNATSIVKDFNNNNLYRKVSHSDINLPLNIKATYKAFLNDLKEILIQTKPQIILTPHPSIDSNSDHKYTTYALFQAIKETNTICKILLYTNHLELSETYPIGEIHSSISLPPNKNEFYFDGIYSFELDKDTQIDKFFALESLHDLRNSLVFLSIKKAYKHLEKMIKRKITAKDKSYYKRAIRANELFFVVDSNNIDKLKI